MEFSHIIGVDVGKLGHHAVTLGLDGNTVRSVAMHNRQGDIDSLVGWAGDNAAAVVVDQPHGGAALLVQACWDAGVRIGYLHGLAMARARDFYEGEAKTDPKDAYVIADVARAHPTRIVWLQPIPQERAELELLCGHDEDLRADANRLTNRLRDLLATHHPALEQALDQRLSSPAILQLLAAHPGAEAVQRLGRAKLIKFLRRRRIRKPEALADALLRAAGEQHTTVAGTQTANQIIGSLAVELERVLQRRTEVGNQIQACFRTQHDAPILLSLPGIGPRLGARMLVEIGDIRRFANPSKLAAYAGLGPSQRQSGSSINTTVASRRGNHRLKNAMFLAAFASLRHPPSRAYYDRKRKEGRGHNEAVRCLARRRVDVIHALLTHRQIYTWNSPQPETQEPSAA